MFFDILNFFTSTMQFITRSNLDDKYIPKFAKYRRDNPGSKLQTAVTTPPSKLKKGSKAAKRRKSFCARSAGQLKKFPKAAKDPNSRLRQARRRWNC